MRQTLLKRGLRVVLAGGAAAAMLAVTIQPAGSQVPPEVLTIAGSDTLEFVTDDIIATFPAPVAANTYNVRPAGVNPPALTVPGDGFCGAVIYDPAEGVGQLKSDSDADGRMWNPNGSGEGRTALKQAADPALLYGNATIDTGNGCIDVARSSSAPGNTDGSADPAEFEFYGFALDAVGWGTTSLNAPTSLKLQQVKDIYACATEAAAGLTAPQQAIDADSRLNNWAEVGGAPGQISRAMIQAGSGTRSFFISNVLGGGAFPNGLAASGCPDVVFVQENDGTEVLSSANEGRYNEYILPYSSGKWVYQVTNKINPTVDIRGGVRMGAIERDSTIACPASPIAGMTANNAPAFSIRYDGAGYLLNAATLVCSVSLTVDGTGSSLTAPAGTFSAGMVGLAVQGTNINEGTVVTSVNGPGSTATISPGVASNFVAGTVRIGISVVNEFNPNVTSSGNVSIFPGVRELFHVLDTRGPSYAEARSLFGFTAGTGTKSPLCDAVNESEIVSNGFLNLTPVTNNGTPATSCRLL